MKNAISLITRCAVLILVAAGLTIPVLAAEGNWKLDADHSTARILLGASTFEVGVARLSGTIDLNAAEPANSVFDVSIAPAGTELIRFNSQHVVAREGRLAFTGDLKLIHVVREVTANAAEDYYGPIYGEPVVQPVAREITFVLPKMDRGERDEVAIAAEGRIFKENFPELFADVADVSWPPVIQDEACVVPAAGEDFSGAACVGTVVEPNRRGAFASVGEDYYGFEAGAPEGNLMTIVLNLHLTRENPKQATAR